MKSETLALILAYAFGVLLPIGVAVLILKFGGWRRSATGLPPAAA